jgi:hypothetical protein
MVTFLKSASSHSNKTLSKHTSLSEYLKPIVLSSTIGLLGLGTLPMIANAGDASASPDSVTVKEGVKQIWIDVLANDKNLSRKYLSLSIASKPANGKVNTTSTNKIRYIPNPGFAGQDTFRYRVANPKGKRSTATVTVNVGGKVVANPMAQSDVAVVKEGVKQIWIDVLANDKRLNHKNLSLSIASKPANGKVNTTSMNKIRYIPNPDFAGQDQFLYKVTDKSSGQQAIATVTVDVFDSHSSPDKDDNPSGTNHYVTLKWDPVKHNVQGYTVYTGPTSGLINKQLSNIAINSSKLNKAKPSVRYSIDKDLQLASGEMVCFAVEAYNDIGASELSDPVCEVIR